MYHRVPDMINDTNTIGYNSMIEGATAASLPEAIAFLPLFPLLSFFLGLKVSL